MAGITFVLKVLLLLLTAVSAALVEQAADLTGSKSAVYPDKDPFYAPPAGFESAEPGTIFRYRLLKDRLTFDNTNAIKAKNVYQILYRTQTATGEPEANVATLLEPFNANPKKLFVYHWFSDAAYNACNPSITMQVGTRSDNTYTQLQNLIVVAGMDQGWWVLVTDDGGPMNTFGSGLHVAYTTLDAVRAAQRSKSFTQLDPAARIASYGYSGGGLAAGWFGEMHPLYAPELKIDGIAVGGIIPNTTALIDFFNKKAKSSYGPPMIMGLARDYKNLSDWVVENVRPDKKDFLYKTYDICYDGNFYNYTNMDLGDFFKGGFAALHSEIPQSVFKWSGTMGLRGTPIAPWYLHGTMTDDSSPIEYAEALYNKYCTKGANIYFEKNITPLNHSEEMIASVGGAISWVKNRLDGVPVQPGCQVAEVQKGYLQGLTDPMLVNSLWNDYLVWMGSKIGPATPTLFDWLIPQPIQNMLDPFTILGKILRPTPGAPGTWFPQLLSTIMPGLSPYIGGAPWSDLLPGNSHASNTYIPIVSYPGATPVPPVVPIVSYPSPSAVLPPVVVAPPAAASSAAVPPAAASSAVASASAAAAAAAGMAGMNMGNAPASAAVPAAGGASAGLDIGASSAIVPAPATPSNASPIVVVPAAASAAAAAAGGASAGLALGGSSANVPAPAAPSNASPIVVVPAAPSAAAAAAGGASAGLALGGSSASVPAPASPSDASPIVVVPAAPSAAAASGMAGMTMGAKSAVAGMGLDKSAPFMVSGASAGAGKGVGRGMQGLQSGGRVSLPPSRIHGYNAIPDSAVPAPVVPHMPAATPAASTWWNPLGDLVSGVGKLLGW